LFIQALRRDSGVRACRAHAVRITSRHRRSAAGRDAQPLKSNHGIISENMAIFRNIDKYIYLQIY